jgi:transposase InsO family protein
MTKPTPQQIIEAENLAWSEVPDDLRSGNYNRMLHRFAMHFYKQGLLDAAEKCEEIGEEYGEDEIHAAWFYQELRDMADEVGKGMK